MSKVCFLFCLSLLLYSYSLSAQVVLSAPDSSVIEVQPEFPGGVQAFFKYLNKHLKYPKSVSKSLYHGKVTINFIIDQNGKVVADSLNFEKMSFYSEKAVETLKAQAKADLTAMIESLFAKMPDWKPGTQNGKPVRVKYTIPINIGFD
ncbi:energy transducer TonB [Telluribacter humicola]|uniref:energy transducer TonB n=1 Tax=Telluribacter humicola TaxID=1720261 RepID=UPI001A957D6F|nr:energy transducer TonB [Telluribacter humicola]